VPVGKDDTENVLIRTWGKPPKFKFEPKSHLDLAIQNGWIDIDRATKSSGNSFYYLRGPMVLLDLAIQRFTLDFLATKGYIAVEPPFMLRGGPFEAATDADFLKDQIYKIDKEDLFLIGTAENAIAAMLQDEVFDNKDLPLKFAGLSACFRREVGSHGKYTKGLFRVHQFNKIEQFIFCHPDDSWKYFEELQKNAELLYQKLGIHHRVVNVCTGDIGVMAAKKYDTEAWMCDGTFREVGSCSNDTDYQARRLNIRWREGVGKAPAGMLHTLNNTALATSRTMIAILEQHQQSDGTVKIPVPLQKYIGMKILKPISAKK
jgi:seryl-tRNA synthetase